MHDSKAAEVLQSLQKTRMVGVQRSKSQSCGTSATTELLNHLIQPLQVLDRSVTWLEHKPLQYCCQRILHFV